MMIAYAAMMAGNMQALDRVLRIVGALDRCHGFRAAATQPAAAATRALAASAPALALPAPIDVAENFPAKD
jgi:hypothetical protein